MNNDYKGNSWSERFSWIITIVAMVLVAILSIGLLCALFIQPKDDKQEDTEQTAVNEQATVVDGGGNAMVSGKTYAMPQRMVFAATAAETATASEGITLTATVSPETADNKAVDWSVAFVNQSSSWAKGKNVTDYVTVMPSSDGALTATVNCLKAFGEQIIITVTSRANPRATAECTLDYARRILDTALYSEGRDTLPLEFGKDEVLVDLVIPSYEDFASALHDGTLWAGDYGSVWLYHGSLTPEEESDPWTNWADEDISRTFKFSDYTIKDNLIVAPMDGVNSDYVAKIERNYEVPDAIKEIYSNFATEVTLKQTGQVVIYSFAELFTDDFVFGNNPLAILASQDRWEAFAGFPDFTEELYYEYMEEFVNWFRENPDTPIAEYIVTYTGKYSTFTRHFTFRYNPETVEMPVFSLGLDKTEVVI